MDDYYLVIGKFIVEFLGIFFIIMFLLLEIDKMFYQKQIQEVEFVKIWKKRILVEVIKIFENIIDFLEKKLFSFGILKIVLLQKLL